MMAGSHLPDAVEHYEEVRHLGLTGAEKAALLEYLKSL